MKYPTAKIVRLLGVLLIFFIANSIVLADGIDLSFRPQIRTSNYLPKAAYAFAEMPDGKIIVAGTFNSYNGEPVGGLIRINPDGTLDSTFNNNLFNDNVGRVLLFPVGDKLLVARTFTLANGTTYTNKIVRLNADGSLDPTFSYALTGSIYDMQVDSRGYIAVAGLLQYEHNGEIVRKKVVVLDQNGSIDFSFDAAYTTDPSVNVKINFQENKMVIVDLDAASMRFLARRLNQNGTADNSFTATDVGDSGLRIVKMLRQADNKLLLMLDWTVIRIKENGEKDVTGFSSPSIFSGQALDMFLESDGRIVVMHKIAAPTTGVKVMKMLQDGLSDPSYTEANIPMGFGGSTPFLQRNGGVLLGDLQEMTGDSSNYFKHLLPSGLVDSAFNAGGAGFLKTGPGTIRAIRVLPDGKIIIGGVFGKIGNLDVEKISRLNDDGTPDPSFNIKTSEPGNWFFTIRDIYHIVRQSDGKLIVSGNFGYVLNGVTKANIVRLNSDGSIDPTFNFSVSFQDDSEVNGWSTNKAVSRSDGSIIFGTTRPISTKVPLGLNANGSNSSSFVSTFYPTAGILAALDIGLQPDGKILLSGRVESVVPFLPVRRGFMARLNADGSVDPTFQTFETSANEISRFVQLSDNRLLVVSRSVTQSMTQSTIFRLNSNGTKDIAFESGVGANGKINSLSLLSNNKVLIGGGFNTYNGQPRRNLAVIDASGMLLEDVATTNGDVFETTLDNEGRVLVGGSFSNISTSEQSNGPGYLARISVASASAVQNKTTSDFDGDGRSDLAVWRESDNIWYHTDSSNNSYNTFKFGTAGDRIVPGDYDGDGKTDFAIWKPSTTVWTIQRSSAGLKTIQFGLPDDLPVQGDYDGDGKTDIAVWRPSTGVWYVLKTTEGSSVDQFGQVGDKPVPGDYDGDGKTDLAVYRPSTGVWFIMKSSQGLSAVQFGIPTDKVVPADYDGDGKTDLAVYRDGPFGLWYLLQSTAGFAVTQWGTTGDIPVPGDYDGDGKADLTAWRPSTGIWFQQRSSSGFLAAQFGQVGDKPIPAAYVPVQ